MAAHLHASQGEFQVESVEGKCPSEKLMPGNIPYKTWIIKVKNKAFKSLKSLQDNQIVYQWAKSSLQA